MALRQIRKLHFPDIEPNEPDTDRPEVREVDPLTLHVDEAYQRNLSERSRALIRKMVAGWDWRAFKPPVVVDVAGMLHVLDGQHTAIAAASHPHVGLIPVLVVDAAEETVRAASFVKHNRDRINATPTQLHYALVAAGDETALTIAQVCERAGVVILKNPPAGGIFKPGETLSVQTISGLVSRRHALGARRVLEVCTEARLAPVSAAAIRAVENLLYADEFDGEYDSGDVATALRGHFHTISHEAHAFSAQHKVPLWRGLAVAIGRKTRRRRRGHRSAA